MARTPVLKVYTADNVYVGSVWEPEAAAVLVAWYGHGATIRIGHTKQYVAWVEGGPHYGNAQDSYDAVSDHIILALRDKARGKYPDRHTR